MIYTATGSETELSWTKTNNNTMDEFTKERKKFLSEALWQSFLLARGHSPDQRPVHVKKIA